MSDGGLIAAVVIESLLLASIVGYYVNVNYIRPYRQVVYASENSDQAARDALYTMRGGPAPQTRYAPAAPQYVPMQQPLP